MLRPLPHSCIRITGGLLGERRETVARTTLAAIGAQIEATGRLENFRRAARRESGGHQGRYYDDSDVTKWLEACAYCDLDTGFAATVSAAINDVAAAQEPDGYLNTYFQLERPTMKWRSLHAMHELYCLGHLIEAGVAWKEARGDERLLSVAIRAADLVDRLFGPSGHAGYPGHPELELALVRLAQCTREARYKALARVMIDRRGMRPSPFAAEVADPEVAAMNLGHANLVLEDGVYSGAYLQDHAPIRTHDAIVGHAVRSLYLYAGATDCAWDDPAMAEALQRVWENLVGRRLYVTGGVGSSARNEGFTRDWDLPNRDAYAETCASAALCMWAVRMLEQTGSSEYADVLERALFNGALAGLSQSGDRFFYANPLESAGGVERVPWFACACCPPNIARFLGSIGRYLAGVSDDGVWIHVPVAMEIEALVQGVPVSLRIEGDYPWDGAFSVRVEPDRPVRFTLRMRIPDWCDDATFELAGAEQGAEYEDGYAVWDREWHPGDTIRADLAMTARWVRSDPRVLDNAGRVALERGPIVYCLEETDLGAPPQTFAADPEAPIESGDRECTVRGWLDAREADSLYSAATHEGIKAVEARMVPYSTWGNQGAGAMQVWLRG